MVLAQRQQRGTSVLHAGQKIPNFQNPPSAMPAFAPYASAMTLQLLLSCLIFAGSVPISTARRVEVYGFAVANTPTYKGYDWSLLTTSAWRTDPELVQLAAQHGAKVELNAGNVAGVMGSEAKRQKWVDKQVVELVKVGAGGINFDLEIPIKAGSQAASDYTALVNLTAAVLHAAVPGATVSVDVPWSPFDVDGRNYDWKGLATAADLLFVMVYDTQSQILGRCIAGANSPIDAVRRAVRQWLDLGVPADKMVLGLPWYGYDYPCQGPDESTAAAADVDVCKLKPVAFQNVSCSDAAGAQRCYYEIMQMLHPKHAVNTTEVRWEATQASPYFNYRAKDGSIHQIWYDDPKSLALKYQVAVEYNLRGIGFWNLDCLDYASTDPLVQQQTRAMWSAVQTTVQEFQTRIRLQAS